MEAVHQAHLPPATADESFESPRASSTPTVAALSVAATLAVVFGVSLWMRKEAPAVQTTAARAATAAAPRPVSAPAEYAPPPDEPDKPDKADSRPEKSPAPQAPAQVSLEDLISRTMPAVVRIETRTGSGSGFFVRPDTILTN